MSALLGLSVESLSRKLLLMHHKAIAVHRCLPGASGMSSFLTGESKKQSWQTEYFDENNLWEAYEETWLFSSGTKRMPSPIAASTFCTMSNDGFPSFANAL